MGTKTADRERRKEGGKKKEGRRARITATAFSIWYIYIFTKVQKLDRLEKFVLGGEILPRPLGAVILDVWKAAGSQYVVIAAARRPIEVRHPPLIVHHIGVPHEIRRPRWLLRLNQVARQHLHAPFNSIWNMLDSFLEAKLHCRHLVIITLSFVTNIRRIFNCESIQNQRGGERKKVLSFDIKTLEANDSNFPSVAPRPLLSSPTVIRSDIYRPEFSNRSEESAAVTWRARSSCVKQRWFLGPDRSRGRGGGWREFSRSSIVIQWERKFLEMLVGFARTLKRAYVGTWSIDVRKRKPDVKREPRNLPLTLKASSSWKQSSPK